MVSLPDFADWPDFAPSAFALRAMADKPKLRRGGQASDQMMCRIALLRVRACLAAPYAALRSAVVFAGCPLLGRRIPPTDFSPPVATS
jgi:hypothetical protein